ncbi:MAG: tetraacyldisaccharide 4'-kinase [Gammaproteobacteria bacterium]|nr:tetraacyldisaccharide 4'-kinase [Gammaproteobacteria bacterium]
MPKPHRILDHIWYGRSAWAWALLPLSGLYRAVVGARRLTYRVGIRKAQRLAVPVIVVGNLTVGGTGKTPLVTWLAQFLRAHGYRPGLVARGYGGRARHWPQQVRPDSDPATVGDEPVLLARATGCPMAVAPDRVAAARALLAHSDCDVIISDDGLQHHALDRDVEIVVIDGVRRFGNGHCLPAGPLREPARRLAEVGLVVSNGPAQAGEFAMLVQVTGARNLVSGEQRPLVAFRGTDLHAVAGIGRPERFFGALREQGLDIQAHAFPDHHRFRAEELAFPGSVLMTEKDAVKCQAFAQPSFWVVGTRIELDPAFGARVLELLRGTESGPDGP